jgi:general stress protein YciG
MSNKNDDEKMTRSEAGRKGGEVAHEKGTAHEFTSEEAREAGHKGGEAAHGE